MTPVTAPWFTFHTFLVTLVARRWWDWNRGGL